MPKTDPASIPQSIELAFVRQTGNSAWTPRERAGFAAALDELLGGIGISDTTERAVRTALTFQQEAPHGTS